MRPLTSILPALCLAAGPLTQALHLNLTAIAARNGSSVLECWRLDSPLAASAESGTAGALLSSLGAVANLSYTVLPAGFNGGAHNAPSVQYVAFLTGLAHITLPDDPGSEAYVAGGEAGLILAADTAAVSRRGHVTTYPGVGETLGLEIPVEGGVPPAHTVLYAGACRAGEVAGIRDAAVG